MRFPRSAMVAVTVTASLLLGISTASASVAATSNPAVPSACTSTSAPPAANQPAEAACWHEVTGLNLSSDRMVRDIEVAKKHNMPQGNGINHVGPPTLMVSDSGMVSIAWSLSGANVMSSSIVVVLVSQTDGYLTAEQDDFRMTTDGGMEYRHWMNKKLTTKSYTAAQVAAAEGTAAGTAANSSGASALGGNSIGGFARTASDPTDSCIANLAAVMFLSAAVSALCLFIFWSCGFAMAALAISIYEATKACQGGS